MEKALIKKKKGNLRKRIRRYWPLLIMMLPAIVYFLVFCYQPMYGAILAFKDYKISKGIWGSEWVGLYYFKKLFKSRNFWLSMKNTLGISALKLTIGFFPPIIFALALNEVKIPWLRKLTQTCSYLPYFISWIIMAGIIKEMLSLNGVVNQIVELFGGTPQVWLSQKNIFGRFLSAQISGKILDGDQFCTFQHFPLLILSFMKQLNWMVQPGFNGLFTLQFQN